jgi:hypothetical protein
MYRLNALFGFNNEFSAIYQLLNEQLSSLLQVKEFSAVSSISVMHSARSIKLIDRSFDSFCYWRYVVALIAVGNSHHRLLSSEH